MARMKHPIHLELGREKPQRRWYFVLRHGRVGRRQVFKEQIFDRGLRLQNLKILMTRGGAVW